MCGMNFINLIRIRSIFGIEDQLILSYNPRMPKPVSFFMCCHTMFSPEEEDGSAIRGITGKCAGRVFHAVSAFGLTGRKDGV